MSAILKTDEDDYCSLLDRLQEKCLSQNCSEEDIKTYASGLLHFADRVANPAYCGGNPEIGDHRKRLIATLCGQGLSEVSPLVAAVAFHRFLHETRPSMEMDPFLGNQLLPVLKPMMDQYVRISALYALLEHSLSPESRRITEELIVNEFITDSSRFRLFPLGWNGGENFSGHHMLGLFTRQFSKGNCYSVSVINSAGDQLLPLFKKAVGLTSHEVNQYFESTLCLTNTKRLTEVVGFEQANDTNVQALAFYVLYNFGKATYASKFQMKGSTGSNCTAEVFRWLMKGLTEELSFSRTRDKKSITASRMEACDALYDRFRQFVNRLPSL